jgi:hypothetical protein
MALGQALVMGLDGVSAHGACGLIQSQSLGSAETAGIGVWGLSLTSERKEVLMPVHVCFTVSYACVLVHT